MISEGPGEENDTRPKRVIRLPMRYRAICAVRSVVTQNCNSEMKPKIKSSSAVSGSLAAVLPTSMDTADVPTRSTAEDMAQLMPSWPRAGACQTDRNDPEGQSAAGSIPVKRAYKRSRRGDQDSAWAARRRRRTSPPAAESQAHPPRQPAEPPVTGASLRRLSYFYQRPANTAGTPAARRRRATSLPVAAIAALEAPCLPTSSSSRRRILLQGEDSVNIRESAAQGAPSPEPAETLEHSEEEASRSTLSSRRQEDIPAAAGAQPAPNPSVPEGAAATVDLTVSDDDLDLSAELLC